MLTVLETGPRSLAATRTGYGLETESKLGYRGDLQYRRETWGLGAEFFWITTGQQLDRTAAAAGGENVAFEVAGATFTSAGPGEVLYFRRLEDTDINAWTFDLYATRRLGGSAASGVEARLGLRVADFDNDHRTAAGIEGAGGLRTDASSNYGALRGPLAGLTGRLTRGRNALEASVAQSVVFGEAELSNQRRTFTGPFSEDPAFVSDARFRAFRDVAIPMTDLRFEWTYRVARMVAVGLSARASTWWNVSVPRESFPRKGPGSSSTRTRWSSTDSAFWSRSRTDALVTGRLAARRDEPVSRPQPASRIVTPQRGSSYHSPITFKAGVHSLVIAGAPLKKAPKP